MAKDTSIGVDTETWQRLSAEKQPGDSFDDVINRVLDERESLAHGNAPRELVIGEDDDPIGRVQLHDDDRHDRVVARALRSLADGLEETAPDDALDPDEVTYVLDDDRRDEPRADHHDHAGDPTPEPDDPDVDDGDSEPMDPDMAALRDVDTPTDTPTRADFETAALAVLNHLRRSGPVTRSGVQAELHEDHAAGYGNERTWWRKVAKPVLQAHPDVVAPDPGGSKWTIVE